MNLNFITRINKRCKDLYLYKISLLSLEYSDSEKDLHQLRTNTSQQMARATDPLQTTYSRIKAKQDVERLHLSHALTHAGAVKYGVLLRQFPNKTTKQHLTASGNAANASALEKTSFKNTKFSQHS